MKLLQRDLLEKDIKNHVKEYLNLKHIFNFHLLQGLGCFRGVPDRIAILPNGKILFIEIKTKKGMQSEYQKEFQRNVENNNQVYLIIRDVQELIDAIKFYGNVIRL